MCKKFTKIMLKMSVFEQKNFEVSLNKLNQFADCYVLNVTFSK